MRVYHETEVGGVPTSCTAQVFEDEDGRGVCVLVDGSWPDPVRWRLESEIERDYIANRDSDRASRAEP